MSGFGKAAGQTAGSKKYNIAIRVEESPTKVAGRKSNGHYYKSDEKLQYSDTVVGIRIDTGERIEITVDQPKPAEGSKKQSLGMGGWAGEGKVGSQKAAQADGVLLVLRCEEKGPGKFKGGFIECMSHDADEAKVEACWFSASHVYTREIEKKRGGQTVKETYIGMDGKAIWDKPIEPTTADAFKAGAIRLLEENKIAGLGGQGVHILCVYPDGSTDEQEILLGVAKGSDPLAANDPVDIVDAWMASDAGKYVKDNIGQGTRFVLRPTSSIKAGKDTIDNDVAKKEKERPTIASFYAPRGDEAAEGPTQFAYSTVAFRQRDNGSWYFTNAKPVDHQPTLFAGPKDIPLPAGFLEKKAEAEVVKAPAGDVNDDELDAEMAEIAPK